MSPKIFHFITCLIINCYFFRGPIYYATYLKAYVIEHYSLVKWAFVFHEEAKISWSSPIISAFLFTYKKNMA